MPHHPLCLTMCEICACRWKVFMTKDGRISLAGLSSSKVAYLAEAMVDSFKNH